MNKEFPMDWSFGAEFATSESVEEKRIETVAHAICDRYEATGPMTLPCLMQDIKDANPEEICMAVGWLAKGGTLSFVGEGVEVSLELKHRQ